MNKIIRFSASVTLVSIIYNCLFPAGVLISLANSTRISRPEIKLLPVEGPITLYGQALVQTNDPDTPVVTNYHWVIITAYSSTVDQTDASPFITASGTNVRDGIVACNFLKFGTRVRFPQLYGNKIFVVEDRMALKNSHKMDIWFASRQEAKQFGIKTTKVEVLKT